MALFQLFSSVLFSLDANWTSVLMGGGVLILVPLKENL